MTRILAFAGKKQSGKNTCCAFLHGYQLRCLHLIEQFVISEDGQLAVNTVSSSESQDGKPSMGLLDVTRTDMEFALWASDNMWPFIKHYSFASALKEICTGLFGITPEQCFGTDIDKNSLTWFKWEDMPGYKGKEKGRMSAREFMQYFGTDICRKIHPDIWTDRTLKSIATEEPLIAVISDCRFQNEVDAVQRAGGKVIKLTRGKSGDGHSSEVAVDNIDGYDAIINNKTLSIEETNGKVMELLNEWGWLGNVIEPPPEPEPDNLVGGIMKIKE